MSTASAEYVATLARFAASLDLTTVPGRVREQAKLVILDTLGAGLAAVPTNLTRFFDAEVRPLLGYPEHVETISLVLLGHPLTPNFGPPRRRPLGEIAYAEAWGKPLP